ncbi:hypothetical protein LTS17_009508 [Exophiala oligosperma]
MAIKLLEAGIKNIVIIEKSCGFGGTWRDNRYPGCRCDVPAHLYSFSFAPNPDWTRVYPDQIEILEYLNKVAADHDLFRYTTFAAVVRRAEWDESSNKWLIDVEHQSSKDSEFERSFTITTDFLISAVGQLNVPYTPKIPGIESFQGKVMHTARWAHDTNLEGLRVGIIGNGATAVQIIPEVAQQTAKLTLFQRSPNWVMPRDDEEYPALTRFRLKYIPMARSMYRVGLMKRGELFWESLTQKGTPMSEGLLQWCLGHMHSQLPGREDLWRKLTPEYAPGCKRILITNDFYPQLLRDNVDLETATIREINEHGVILADGRTIDLDCLVLATGFQTRDLLGSLSIQGVEKSQTLQAKWQQEGVRTLYGVAAEGAPNFGMLYGPNTNLAHNSIILMVEAQAKYIERLVSKVSSYRQAGRRLTVLPRPNRVREYNEYVQKQLSETSFADNKCQSWYKTADGTITNNWGGNVVDYQTMLSRLNWADYDLEGPGTDTFASKAIDIGRVVEEKCSMGAWSVMATVGAMLGLFALFFN